MAFIIFEKFFLLCAKDSPTRWYFFFGKVGLEAVDFHRQTNRRL